MTFVDTNFFVRFLLKDNLLQFNEVKKLFLAGASGKESLFTSTIVFFEIYWVIKSVYKFSKEKITKALKLVLSLDFIYIAEKDVLERTLETLSKNNLDLEDCYNLVYAQTHGAKSFKTFDQKLLKKFQPATT